MPCCSFPEEALIQALTEKQDFVVPESYQPPQEETFDEDEDKPPESKVEWNKVDEYFDLDEEVFPPEDINDLDEDLDIPSDEELDVKLEIDGRQPVLLLLLTPTPL